MAKTAAERQAAYKERHLGDDPSLANVNVVIDLHAKLALDRLAAHHNVTKKAMLERLLLDAQKATLAELPGNEQNAYYDKVTA